MTDEFDFLDQLPATDNYTPLDRYRDFRAVFLASEQGRRVLHEILGWGHMFRPSFVGGGQVDPYRLAIREGERHMALRLLTTIKAEPRANMPTRANTKGET